MSLCHAVARPSPSPSLSSSPTPSPTPTQMTQPNLCTYIHPRRVMQRACWYLRLSWLFFFYDLLSNVIRSLRCIRLFFSLYRLLKGYSKGLHFVSSTLNLIFTGYAVSFHYVGASLYFVFSAVNFPFLSRKATNLQIPCVKVNKEIA